MIASGNVVYIVFRSRSIEGSFFRLRWDAVLSSAPTMISTPAPMNSSGINANYKKKILRLPFPISLCSGMRERFFRDGWKLHHGYESRVPNWLCK